MRRLLLLVGLVLALAGASTSAGTPTGASGVLRIDTTGPMWQTDPALAYFSTAWEAEFATCATLVNYADAPPPEGTVIRPEIAAAMPTISADRRTYTFQIRNDYAFSPPATGVVTAQSMKYTIERSGAPDGSRPGGQFLTTSRGRRST